MNNLKFRAWDKVLKVMSEIVCIDLLKKEITYFETDNCSYKEINVNFNDYIIMQSTGLKDKNGKEIFEGDILKTKTKGIVIVRIENGNTMTTYKSGINTKTSLVLSSFLEKYKVEVIGNIYENKELLENE